MRRAPAGGFSSVHCPNAAKRSPLFLLFSFVGWPSDGLHAYCLKSPLSPSDCNFSESDTPLFRALGVCVLRPVFNETFPFFYLVGKAKSEAETRPRTGMEMRRRCSRPDLFSPSLREVGFVELFFDSMGRVREKLGLKSRTEQSRAQQGKIEAEIEFWTGEEAIAPYERAEQRPGLSREFMLK